MRTVPTTETRSISQFQRGLSALIGRVSRGETRLLIERNGIPVAAFVSPRDLEQLERLDRERAEQFAVLDDIGAAFRDVPFEELEREIARSIDEVRAARRAEQEAVGVGT